MADAFRLRSGLTWRTVDDQAVVLDLQTSEFHELNRSGTALWRLLADGEHSAEELADALVGRFAIEREQAVADVDKFLETLLTGNLIEVIDVQ